jgi:6-phosphofructokinase 1
VMGRNAGFIGLSAAIASASDNILVPELAKDVDIEIADIIAHVEALKQRSGTSSYIIVITENLWPGGATKLAETLEEKTNIECRPVILGHVQRGGSPVSQDRILATKLGAYAVEAAIAGKTKVMVGEINQVVSCLPIEESWTKHKTLDPYLVKIQQDYFDIINRP